MSDDPIVDAKKTINSVVESAEPVQKRKGKSTGSAGKSKTPALEAVDSDLSRPAPPDSSFGPVRGLGINGGSHFYLDAACQVRAMKPQEHSRLGVLSLFGIDSDVLLKLCPRIGRGGVIIGIDYETASRRLMKMSANAGIWSPMGRLRGPGSWRSDAGELVLHCGDAIQIGQRWHKPGIIDRYVYSAGAALPRPYKGAGAVPCGAMMELFVLFRRWNWKRGDTDIRLLIGWIAAAMIAGAIDWRSVVWLVGEFGTGKTHCISAIKALLGAAMIQTADTSEAGLRQVLGHSTLAFTIDEQDREDNPHRVLALVRLARLMASGSWALRGGPDHSASEFMLRSCGLFSSTKTPPLSPQDWSRLAILELGQLVGEDKPELDEAVYAELGSKLRRRLVDQYPRWQETFSAYARALKKVGHKNRGADVFGTLLAAADLLLADDVPIGDYADEIASELKVETLPEAEDAVSDELACWEHLQSTSLPFDNSVTKRPVGELIDHMRKGTDSTSADTLGRYGMTIVRPAKEDRGKVVGKEYLAVASRHAELFKVFANTPWGGILGRGGSWTQSLRRFPGAVRSETVSIRKVSTKCTLVPLSVLIPEDATPNPNPDPPASE